MNKVASHVERRPLARAVVDVRYQRVVPYTRQPVAHLPDRLSRSAGVREDEHARPRAIAVRDVQRAVAVSIGRRHPGHPTGVAFRCLR